MRTLLFLEQRRVRVEVVGARGIHRRTHRILGKVDPPTTNSSQCLTPKGTEHIKRTSLA